MKNKKFFSEVHKKLIPWGVFLIFVLILFTVMTVSLIIEKKYNPSTIIFRRAFPALGYFVPVVLFYFYYRKKFLDFATIFALSPKYLVVGILLKLLLTFFHNLLPVFLISKEMPLSSSSLLSSKLTWEMAGRVIMPVLLGPIFEEIFFRGILLRVFIEYYSLPSAIFFNAVAFALLHIAPIPGESTFIFLMSVIECLFFGVLLASVTYKTKNISFACGFHVANNFLALLME